MTTIRVLSLCLLGLAAPAAAMGGPIGVDGLVGAEWTGIPASSQVGYDPGAPTGNFGSPGPNNHLTAYDIFLRSDGEYVYGLWVADNPGVGNNYANVYLSTDIPNGSNIGIEVQNSQAFIPGVPGYYAMDSSVLTHAETAGVIEFAIPWTFFTSNAFPMAFDRLNPGETLQFRLSQAFGLSVAGGDSFGPDRLGELSAPVPEPGSFALLAIGGTFALGARLRRRKPAAPTT